MHDLSHEINVALVQGTPKRRIAAQYGVTERAARHHMREHLPELLAQASRAVEVAQADSLLDRVEGLYRRTEAILEAAEQSSEWSTALGAIRECRGNLELLGRVTKELQDAPTINLHLNPEWLELRSVIVTTLKPFPEARERLVRALEGGG